MDTDRLITIAIHTFEKAQIIKGVLESEGILTVIQNVKNASEYMKEICPMPCRFWSNIRY